MTRFFWHHRHASGSWGHATARGVRHQYQALVLSAQDSAQSGREAEKPRGPRTPSCLALPGYTAPQDSRSHGFQRLLNRLPKQISFKGHVPKDMTIPPGHSPFGCKLHTLADAELHVCTRGTSSSRGYWAPPHTSVRPELSHLLPLGSPTPSCESGRTGWGDLGQCKNGGRWDLQKSRLGEGFENTRSRLHHVSTQATWCKRNAGAEPTQNGGVCVRDTAPAAERLNPLQLSDNKGSSS